MRKIAGMFNTINDDIPFTNEGRKYLASFRQTQAVIDRLAKHYGSAQAIPKDVLHREILKDARPVDDQTYAQAARGDGYREGDFMVRGGRLMRMGSDGNWRPAPEDEGE